MRWLMISLLCLLLPSAAMAAKKQPPKEQKRCGPAEQALKGLKNSFGEMPFSTFADSDGNDLILFVSPKTWTWTIMQDTHDGQFCAIANGTDFRPADSKALNKLGGTHL